MSTKPVILPLAVATMVLLQGCELKRDEEEAVSPTPSPTASETAALVAQPSESPPASIIRPDVVSEPIVDLPPEPLELTIPFAKGGYKLDDQALALLREVPQSEQFVEGWPIVLRGHTDSAGTDSANLAASRRRAQAVADWLEDNGVDEERITIIPLGEQRPVAPNAHLDGKPDEEGRAQNRRVEIWIGPAGSGPGEDAPVQGDKETESEEET